MKKIFILLILLISLNSFCMESSDITSVFSAVKKNFSSNSKVQNLIRATSETKVAQCGALGISLLAESVRNNDENAMYFGIFLAEAYAQKELQLIDTTYFKKELKQSVQVLKANPSIYTSMCGPFLNELSLALKK